MSLSALALIQAAYYEMNQPAPASVIGSTDPGVLQALYLFYAVGRELRQQYCWPQLKKNYSFTTTNGTSTYALPTDFYSFLTETEWDQTLARPLVGPVTDENYNIILYGVGGATTTPTYRIFGDGILNGQFQIQPTPTATTHTLSFDYLIKNWILQGGTTPAETVANDADTCAFDDDVMIAGLKAKWAQSKGLDSTDLQASYKSKVDQSVGRFYGSYKGSFNRYPKYWRRYFPSQSGSWQF